MSPRKYDMSARQEAAGETRSRIVESAMRLHALQGVLSTSWNEIAEDARVSTATVYRHFPSLAELVPACARVVFDIIQTPTVEEASVQFANLSGPGERLEYLAAASCHCYRRGEQWLHAAYRERDFVPELDQAVRLIQDTLQVLVRAAVGRPLRRPEASTLFVLNDFPFWKSLVDAGHTYRTAEAAVVAAVHAESNRLGLS